MEPAAPPRTGPPTTASGSACSTAYNATAPARCASIRDAAIVRRDPAGNSARAWVFRKTIAQGTVLAGEATLGLAGAGAIPLAFDQIVTQTLFPAIAAGQGPHGGLVRVLR